MCFCDICRHQVEDTEYDQKMCLIFRSFTSHDFVNFLFMIFFFLEKLEIFAWESTLIDWLNQ